MSAKLDAHEYDRVLRSIEILNSSPDPITLAERTTNCVFNLMDNVGTSFDVINKDGQLALESRWTEPADRVTAAQLEVFSEFVHEHPLYEFIVGGGVGVMRITDQVPIQNFEKTNFYNEFLKPAGAKYQMEVHMPFADGGAMTCVLSRKRRDFSDEERMQLELISPHLKQAVVNAQLLQEVLSENEAFEWSLAELSSGVMVLYPDRKAKFQSSAVERMLDKFFPHERRNKYGLPNTVAAWISDCMSAGPKSELSIRPPRLAAELNGDKLKISLTSLSENGEVSVLFKEKRKLRRSQVLTLGLTPREAEVLMLVSKGRTNPEIAELLGISPRTVHKHTENIFVKLGVESRTAAAAKMNDLK